MKIIFDNSPAKLEIETPHGSVAIEIWPGDIHTRRTVVNVTPNEQHVDNTARSDKNTIVTLNTRASNEPENRGAFRD